MPLIEKIFNPLSTFHHKRILLYLRNLNIDSKEFFQSIKKQSVKDQLIKLTTDAFQKEVFGTPTFIVNKKIFWGQDRLEYAIEELKIKLF